MTPNFIGRQVYLDAAPAGIDARFAWTQPGGAGTGVRIIDIEGAWRFTHEDLTRNQGGVIGGAPNPDLDWRNHGTAVIGEFGGDQNTFGITGISHDANVRAISIFGGVGSAGAIRQAALALGAGDVILIELHRPGPRFNFQDRRDQRGYIAIEWWEDDFAAIRFATQLGVIVVEAAGNGWENLDDQLYNTRPAGFPATWTNPFNRTNRDSGAILVGAGAPPPGTHGRDHGPDRSRLDFSNYGSSIDAQGWGREVTTTGYGDLQGGLNEDLWYTDMFSGTSSASPIVVGALACVQGNRRARGLAPIAPTQARELLRTTGSPQQDAPEHPRTQRIGNRPNLRQLFGPPQLRVLVHLQDFGDRIFRENEFAGTRGESRRLEGFELRFSPPVLGLSMRYMAHLQDVGDVRFVNEGRFIGTRGQSRRLEGFAIELTGTEASNYNVFYMAHLQDFGDTRFFQNGQFCGTRGESRRVEGILVRVEPV